MAASNLAINADDVHITDDEESVHFRDYHPSEIYFPYSSSVATTNIHAWLFTAIADLKMRAIDAHAITSPHQLTRILPEVNANFEAFSTNITYLASLDQLHFARKFAVDHGADGFKVFQSALTQFRDLYLRTDLQSQILMNVFNDTYAHLFFEDQIAEYMKAFANFYDEYYEPSSSFKKALLSLALGSKLEYSIHLWCALMPRQLTVLIPPFEECRHNIWIPKGHNLECANCGYNQLWTED